MFERFGPDARQVVVGAQEQARELRHNYIGTEHLLLALVSQPPEVPASRALRALGFTHGSCRADVERIIGRGQVAPSGHIPFTPRCKKVLEMSLREALRERRNDIGSEHILLAILREGSGVAAQILTLHGLSVEAVRQAVGEGAAGGPGTASAVRTPAAEEALGLAARLAAGAPVGSHHLLEALARSGDSMAGRALAALGVDAEAVTGRVDELDLGATTDVTPEQAAAGRTRIWSDGDELHVALSDAAAARRVRELTDGAGAELRGAGPLTGPFIALHRALVDAVDAIGTLLAPAEEAPRATSIRDRLRRRRAAE